MTKEPAPGSAVPNGDVGTGILGKWKYIAQLDAFVGLQDAVEGNVWILQPIGWQDPGGGGGTNVPPTVSLIPPPTTPPCRPASPSSSPPTPATPTAQ